MHIFSFSVNLRSTIFCLCTSVDVYFLLWLSGSDISSFDFSQSVKQLHDLAECSQKEPNAMRTSSSDCSLKRDRNIILENIFQSLDNEGGLKKCIQSALVFQPGSGNGFTVKVCCHLGEADRTV